MNELLRLFMTVVAIVLLREIDRREHLLKDHKPRRYVLAHRN